MVNLSFLGAARQVTGSMFLLDINGYKILIDCGIDMENRKKGSLTPMEFPFEPSEIDAMVLTHAHIDHSGNIPFLFKEGFEGKVYCTNPTYYLSALLLMDCASINLKKLNRTNLNHRGKKKSKQAYRNALDAVYLEHHVKDALKYFESIPFGKKHKITDGISFVLNETGHLLGAANVIFYIEDEGQTKTICFSGDIGRDYYPLLNDPRPIPEVDYLVTESTYGGRNHESERNYTGFLEKVIRETCVEKKGRLVIPAFSMGRTQALLFELKKLYRDTDLPKIRVFVDSPLAIEGTKAFQHLHHYLNDEAREMQEEEGEIFDFDNLHYIESERQSRILSNYYEPCIILSASGMLDGGRIQEHIKSNIVNPKNTVLMVGFSAEGTLGRKLQEHPKQVRIDSKTYDVKADIQTTSLFSGHGDHKDLVKFVETQDPKKLKKLFLVHGEEASMQLLEDDLRSKGYPSIEKPMKGQQYAL